MSSKEEKRHSEDEGQKPAGITRRDVLKLGGKAALVGAAIIATKGKVLAATPEAKDETTHETAGQEAHESSFAKGLDMTTALMVAGNFGRHVLWNGALKGKDLGPRSAAEMNALAWLRIGALKASGDEHLSEHAGHEIAEIESGLLPMPLLVALSDATTTELKVNAPHIFEKVRGCIEPNLKYANVKRPQLSANANEWGKYLEGVNKDIVTQTAQIAAITSVLAPLGTTYTSSSLANTLKEEILRMLYEQSAAMEVNKIKKEVGEDPNSDETTVAWSGPVIDRIRNAAKQRAETLFNGSWGFSKLMVTLAANTQGSWGLGDPPEIYFVLDNINDPETLAKAHAFGAINSEVYTIMLNAIWLKKAGVPMDNALQQFLNGQKTVLQTIWKSLTDKDLGSVSFNGAGRHVENFKAALSDDNDPSGKLRKFLQKLPKPYLKFSWRKYLRDKIRLLNGQEKRIREIMPSAIRDGESLAGSRTYHDLYKAFSSGDRKEAKAMVKALEARMQDAKAKNLAGLFESLLNGDPYSPEEEEATEEAVVQDQNKPDNGHVTRIMAEVSHVMLEMDKGDRDMRVKKALAILGVVKTEKHDDPRSHAEKIADRKSGVDEHSREREIFDALNQADETTIAKAISEFTSLEGKEDVVEGFGDEEKGHEHDPSILSHSAKEVLWALLTQIPSVPAISRLADISIPKIAGVEADAAPTPAQLKTIVAAMLPIEAGMSGLADNVAAYMFAKIVLIRFFERTFGSDVWQEFPRLQGEIGIVAKMIAEQAGSLTKVGNGPNFSQEKCVIDVPYDGHAQGIGINRVNVGMGETLPQKNAFSSIANGTLVAGAIAYLWRQIDNVAEARAKKTPAQVQLGRRDLFAKLFGRTA